jgi:HAD superfamily hydrolase (TIGR01484 family)
MNLSIKLISTDFDGTLFAEFENPPVPEKLQQLLGDLQSRGAKWVINTGREMSSLMEALARARISVQPDYLILVEREIYVHDGVRYTGLAEWNSECARLHEELFARVEPDLPRLTEWVNARFKATVYQDPFSPFCLLAADNGEADAIYDYLAEYSRGIPNLAVVRNDVYARFSHVAYNKGTAMAELARRLNLTAEQVFAAGDHLNDVPMLSQKYARCLAAPQNAVEPIKSLVRSQNGFVSGFPHGDGVAEALEFYLSAGT